MIAKTRQKLLFILVPTEAVFCVTNVETVDVQFTVQSLVSITVGISERFLRPVRFVVAAYDESVTAK